MTATLRWTPNLELDLAGYKIKWGLSPTILPNVITIPLGALTQLITEWTILDLPDRVPVYFAMTAYDNEGNESTLSSVVTKTNKVFRVYL